MAFITAAHFLPFRVISKENPILVVFIFRGFFPAFMINFFIYGLYNWSSVKLGLSTVKKIENV